MPPPRSRTISPSSAGKSPRRTRATSAASRSTLAAAAAGALTQSVAPSASKRGRPRKTSADALADSSSVMPAATSRRRTTRGRSRTSRSSVSADEKKPALLSKPAKAKGKKKSTEEQKSPVRTSASTRSAEVSTTPRKRASSKGRAQKSPAKTPKTTKTPAKKTTSRKKVKTAEELQEEEEKYEEKQLLRQVEQMEKEAEEEYQEDQEEEEQQEEDEDEEAEQEQEEKQDEEQVEEVVDDDDEEEEVAAEEKEAEREEQKLASSVSAEEEEEADDEEEGGEAESPASDTDTDADTSSTVSTSSQAAASQTSKSTAPSASDFYWTAFRCSAAVIVYVFLAFLNLSPVERQQFFSDLSWTFPFLSWPLEQLDALLIALPLGDALAFPLQFAIWSALLSASTFLPLSSEQQLEHTVHTLRLIAAGGASICLNVFLATRGSPLAQPAAAHALISFFLAFHGVYLIRLVTHPTLTAWRFLHEAVHVAVSGVLLHGFYSVPNTDPTHAEFIGLFAAALFFETILEALYAASILFSSLNSNLSVAFNVSFWLFLFGGNISFGIHSFGVSHINFLQAICIQSTIITLCFFIVFDGLTKQQQQKDDEQKQQNEKEEQKREKDVETWRRINP